jgi:hypothetical protein
MEPALIVLNAATVVGLVSIIVIVYALVRDRRGSREGPHF